MTLSIAVLAAAVLLGLYGFVLFCVGVGEGLDDAPLYVGLGLMAPAVFFR